MKIEFKSLLLSTLPVVVLGIWTLWYCCENCSDGKKSNEESITYRSKNIAEKNGMDGRVEHRIGRAAACREPSGGRSMRRPIIPDEIENLSEEDLKGLCKELMEELKDATKNDSLWRIRKAIALFNLPESRGGLGGIVPKILRLQAVEALGACGAGAIADLIDFLADGNAEIADQALEEIKDGLTDPELTDQERADLLVSMMKAMVDGDDISMMLMDLNGMKDSVRGDALQRILKSGSSQSQKVVKSELEIYTEMGVKDAESLKEWTDKAKRTEAGQDEVIKPDTDEGDNVADPAGSVEKSPMTATAANETESSGR